VTVASSLTRFLTFELEQRLYALPAAEVAEVIRVPAVARVPQGPAALLGVANLRGSVLPVASLAILIGGRPRDVATACAIVLDVGAPVSIVVDAVVGLVSAGGGSIRSADEISGAHESIPLLGAFAVEGTQQVARILDIRALLNAAFARRAQTKTRDRVRETAVRPRQQAGFDASEMLVTFEVAGQEFAVPVAAVQEILPVPAAIDAVTNTEAAVLGIVSLRDRLLPLLSLRTLLGFGVSAIPQDRQKVVVLKIGDSQVGLVADRARAIIAADSRLVDPLPAVLAARTGGESRIRSIYRGDGGQRLISILSPEHLFRNEVMQRLTASAGPENPSVSPPESAAGQELIFLVFRLGGDEFGLPIEAVVEVAQVPEQITRVPRAPKFLEGVVNLRGEVLPVVDQRRRFDMPSRAPDSARRLVVVRTARHRAGLIVDSLSDVLRTRSELVQPPPELTDATSRLIHGVLNLEKTQRMVLLLDPAELLTRAEQGLLDTFQSSKKKADA
jgi:purine-binding chemotaxis protein CheW